MLTSDGLRTFVLFRYKSLEWHTSRVLRPRGPATAGMNAGDRFNGFNVVNDLEDIRNLVNMTNVKSQGLFVYRIDLGPSKQISRIELCAIRVVISRVIHYHTR